MNSPFQPPYVLSLTLICRALASRGLRLSRAALALREWNMRRLSRRDLRAMGERELRDLGLSAAQVMDEIDKPFRRL